MGTEYWIIKCPKFICAVPSMFFHIYLQQNDLPDDLAAYFLFLILYDKTLAI